jgi:hypothetical protein
MAVHERRHPLSLARLVLVGATRLVEGAMLASS